MTRRYKCDGCDYETTDPDAYAWHECEKASKPTVTVTVTKTDLRTLLLWASQFTMVSPQVDAFTNLWDALVEKEQG